ncbi:HAD family hydrolase [Skermania sp. ID1734]|uniref:HAD hydrolase-like protein n=1 Tax=Skermania sp. ID1734 TaxID=2597516 RepID=UPI00117D2F21|nr:HAD hydrolase-like protein [Skermania sp. ID1734]TSE01083.1 HAD family hydrolase [Skermania sp. ID1734]
MPRPASHPIVLFDLDGTLTDSAAGILAGFRHALQTVGFPPPDHDRNLVGPPMVELFRELGLPEADMPRATAAYYESYDAGGGWARNRVFDGMETLLKQLYSNGFRMGVATSKSEVLANRILNHFGLAECFEYIGGASPDLTRRDKAQVIAHTLAAMGKPVRKAATSGVVMVGDRAHDITGAAYWGIPAIFVEWGYGVADEGAGAQHRVSTVEQLGALLGV